MRKAGIPAGRIGEQVFYFEISQKDRTAQAPSSAGRIKVKLAAGLA
jgi:hypothetical protein